MRRARKIIVFSVIALLLASSPLFAVTRTWDGGGADNNWSTQNNWSANKVPKPNDNAVFDNTSDKDAVIDGNIAIKSISVNAGYDGTIQPNAGVTIDAGGDIEILSGTFNAVDSTIQVAGHFNFLGGALDMGTSTLVFDGGTSDEFTPGGVSYYKVTLNKNTNTNTITITGTATVSNALTLTNGMFDGGTINAAGAINLASAFDGGSTSLVINGGGNQTLTGGGSAATGAFLPLTINKGSGTLTLASIIRTGSNWTYTTGTLDVTGSTVVFAGGDLSISGSVTLNNLTFNSGNTFTILAGTTLTVPGTLALTDGTIDTGTINAEGAINVGAGMSDGTATLELTAAGDQTITGSGGQIPDTLNINKPSDSVLVTGDTTFTNVNLQNSTLTFQGGSTYTFDATGTGIVTSTGTTLNFSGTAGNLVTLRRTGIGDWIVNVHADGTYTAAFVDVDRSNATGQLMYATDSTGSFNTNWFLIDQIIFTSAEQTVNLNTVSEIITVELQNNGGGDIAVAEDITLDLTTTSGTGQFFSDTAGTNEITSITISSGNSSADFYYKDSVVGTPTMTATENPSKSWDDGVQNITIEAGVDHYQVTVTSPLIAGEVFGVELIAQDAFNQTVVGYSDRADLTLNYISPATGTEILQGKVNSVKFTDGVASTSNNQYDDAGTITITATDTKVPTLTGTSSIITVRPNSFTIVPNSTTQEAGTNFTLTITALALTGATTRNYSGTVALSTNYIDPATGTSTLTPAQIIPANFTNGVAEITDANYIDAGTITITATDSTFVPGVDITGTTESIFFGPANFLVELSEIPASREFYYIDELFDMTVTARNADNNIIPNYRGTIAITNASKVGLFSTYTFTAADAGQHTFEDLLATEEDTFTIEVRDSANSQASGTSDEIEIKFGQIVVLFASGPVGSLEVDVELRDSNEDIITTDDSTEFLVTIEETIDDESATSNTLTTPITVAEGTAKITITNDQGETVTVTPISTPALEEVAGSVVFGTVSGSGIGIQLWREIREPAQYEDYKEKEEE